MAANAGQMGRSLRHECKSKCACYWERGTFVYVSIVTSSIFNLFILQTFLMIIMMLFMGAWEDQPPSVLARALDCHQNQWQSSKALGSTLCTVEGLGLTANSGSKLHALKIPRLFLLQFI